jgi:hypothetical protein
LYFTEKFEEAIPFFVIALTTDEDKDQFYFIRRFQDGSSLAKSLKINQARKVLGDAIKDI